MRYRTAEAVTPAHPDKVADQISDVILEACMAEDPNARVAVECAIGHGHVHLTGEITKVTRPFTDGEYRRLVDLVLERCRYAGYEYDLTVAITEQSRDIARGVDPGGAGDQGIMVGYACRENEEMIPQELYLARKILKHLWTRDERIRDAKCQVTLDEALDPQTVVVSAERVPAAEIREAVLSLFHKPSFELIVNPAGDWTGGMDADAGVTGRKIVQDAYGPRVQVGGGAYSGKDATKVDRTAAYRARRAALDVIAHYPEAREVKVTVAYAIGKADPIGFTVEMDGGPYFGEYADAAERFKPARMIEDLALRTHVGYAMTAAWGAYGLPIYPWEKR